MELRAVLPDLKSPPPMIDFIDGLSNLDIPADHIGRAIRLITQAADGGKVLETTWLMWE